MANMTPQWRRYYEQHQALYAYLVQHCEPLFVVPGHEPIYTVVENALGRHHRLPKFIHWIGRLTVDEAEYLGMVHNLETCYRDAIGIKFRRYPVNFPVIHREIEQINISRHYAFKSETVTGNRLLLMAMRAPDDANNMAALREVFERHVVELEAVGLPAHISVTQRLSVFGSTADYLELTIGTGSLYEYAGCDRVQKRTFTGEHYRARLRAKGESSGYRGRFGLIVLDQNSRDNIVEANKQGDRPHRLDVLGARIPMPIELDFDLYRRPIEEGEENNEL
ncbi:hypothetical protein N7366_25080 [Aeromonas caviae]|uniref:Uncharacterized protein n=2 Tax=Aeromonas TaxID=642 RepID=A0AA42RCN6_AERCA|nr:hypothetical protein [Aeromonas caviae]MDH0436437.1 hypothetical protein [Aeromonas caviae]MDH0939078.1 hypothetical protein [Aeromonas caviae]MDH1399910.1 hypothetical protein [Aeromonas caviae]MDH1507599.1 hypothetical protein [Aeromonas caviae]MDH1807350.1 hypothetical protein [Aeromonas caviae]